VHHSAEHLDWLVNTRAHPFDVAFVRMAGLAPVFLLGLAYSPDSQISPVVALLQIFGVAWTFFIHANFRFRFGPLEWLISTPAYHHWHHTREDHRDRNFAFVFPVIDRIFGTAWLPQHWPASYGVGQPVAPTLAGQFFDPLLPRPASINAPGDEKKSAAATDLPA
jgi:sterol desaturase/sphingolipid hydroxylase (fatty acid hydroxylase superfamily)